MQAVIDKIMEAKSVAVLTHLNEDPDTIGSCFAFAILYLKQPVSEHIAVYKSLAISLSNSMPIFFKQSIQNFTCRSRFTVNIICIGKISVC